MSFYRLCRTAAVCLSLLFTLTAAYANPLYIANGNLSENAGQAGDVKQINDFNSWYNSYTDYPAGYRMVYPKDMQVDVSLSKIRTVFFNPTTKIEVYYDDFNNTETTARDYIYYGNRFFRNVEDHKLVTEYTFTVNGCKAHLTKWERRRLARVDYDKNYYACAEIVKNDHEVYTVFFKSSLPIENELDIINSFEVMDRRGRASIYKTSTPSLTPRSRETQEFYRSYFGPDSKLSWGIFEPSAPETFSYLEPIETAVDYTFPILLRYQSMDENAPLRGLTKAYEKGRFVELTLQTVNPGLVNALLSENGDENARLVYEILDGRYDAYLHEYAARLKAFGHPVLFRLNNEMNGDWCWYSAYYTSKDADLYIAMWRYIHNLFVADGVDNVLWVWNPHDVSRPDFNWNHSLVYYPGDEYVDLIGLTGYNTGTHFPGEYWREFAEIYDPLYANYSQIFEKPFIITEFASSSVGGNKAAWINNMFGHIAAYPRIKAAIWWSGVDYDEQGRPGRIYLIDEDEKYLEIFREYLDR